MTPQMEITRSDSANKRPEQWRLGSLYKDEPLVAEHESKHRLFWFGALRDKLTLAYQTGVSAEQGHSESGLYNIKDHPITGRVLFCTFPSGEPSVQAAAALHLVIRSFAQGIAEVFPSASTRYSVLPDTASSRATAMSSQLEAGELSTIMGSLQRNVIQALFDSAVSIAIDPEIVDVAPANLTSESEVHLEAPLHPIVQSFAAGIAGVRPSPETLEAAAKIVEAAIKKTSEREIEVDETDGALSFELRLDRGLLVVGELSLLGNLHVNVYDDQHPNINASIEEIWVKHLPLASAEDIIALL